MSAAAQPWSVLDKINQHAICGLSMHLRGEALHQGLGLHELESHANVVSINTAGFKCHSKPIQKICLMHASVLNAFGHACMLSNLFIKL